MSASLSDDHFVEDFASRKKVDSIIYYMLCMRPDISFAIGLLTRKTNKSIRVAAAIVAVCL